MSDERVDDVDPFAGEQTTMVGPEEFMRWHRALTYKIEKAEEARDKEIERIKGLTENRTATWREALRRHEESLRNIALAEWNRTNGKAKRLNTFSGYLQLRTPATRLVVDDEDRVLDYLVAAGLGQYVRTKQWVAKDALKKDAAEGDMGAAILDGRPLLGVHFEQDPEPTHTIKHLWDAPKDEAGDEPAPA